jgi:hypothetical protein
VPEAARKREAVLDHINLERGAENSAAVMFQIETEAAAAGISFMVKYGELLSTGQQSYAGTVVSAQA